MKRGFIYILLCALFGLPTSWVNAKELEGETKRRGGSGSAGVAANCSAPFEKLELDVNNVRALIQSGGDMWWDLVGKAQYEVPKGSGHTAIFAGSLWLGGEDVAGQLKVAAQRFRSRGNDFWTGPLSTTDAEITAQTCKDYDKFFVSTRDEVKKFIQWNEAKKAAANGDPTALENDFKGYTVPEFIKSWPAHGRTGAPYNEDNFLAPFKDVNGDDQYSWEDGDYPRYNFNPKADCGQKIVDIYGDKNLWWIFNDKGNVHTETGSPSIGMEIHGQAFGFSTNDEVNNMTFYNYKLINRSTFTLTNAYFGFWVDTDLGNPRDDYVGCDVERGLGFAYNGDENDEDNSGNKGYGLNPPAIGVDFFQGPFQDSDGEDNCLCKNYADAIKDKGVVYGGSGVGYGNQTPDDERLGMRAFLYHNNDNGTLGDPTKGEEYYNYLRSFWKDNSKMVYGGTGHRGSVSPPYQLADFMFPGNSDRLGWGTEGKVQPEWTEVTAGNTPGDRRFIQSAGPFTLTPGAVNNITVGVVYARASAGGAEASVETLKKADEKTQGLFDICFQLIDGPDAPELDITELDGELILRVVNSSASNNFNEKYSQVDPFIAPKDTFTVGGKQYYRNSGDPKIEAEYRKLAIEYRSFKFQGYQIYQLKDKSVSSADLGNLDKAKLIAQCDIKDDVKDLINYEKDDRLNTFTPRLKVENAKNDGIVKSFNIKRDEFAQGDKALINHKTYYFMAVAYAYNQFEPYNPSDQNTQSKPYLASRKSPTGPIRVFTAIPHKRDVQAGGTVVKAKYGQEIQLTRYEGYGNGGRDINFTTASIDEALKNGVVKNPTYEIGKAPMVVKVVDPLNVKKGDYKIAFKGVNSASKLDSANWEITGGSLTKAIVSNSIIKIKKEELIPELGISIEVGNTFDPGVKKDDGKDAHTTNGVITSKMVFSDDNRQWLTGLADIEARDYKNWIRSGNYSPSGNQNAPYWDYEYTGGPSGNYGLDVGEHFEKLLGGTWTAFRMATWNTHGPATNSPGFKNMYRGLDNNGPKARELPLSFLNSVNIYITNDKSKWTRCVVLEEQDDANLAIGKAKKLFPRSSPSVDKEGRPTTATDASTNENDGNYISATGMGWFPGYAIDLETGERLNLAFGEDSYLVSDNGNDMIWNPTSVISTGVDQNVTVRFGGKHYIYVFRNNIVEESLYTNPDFYNNPLNRMPAYDAGKYMIDKLKASTTNPNNFEHVFRACSWVGIPLLRPSKTVLESDVTIELRTSKAFGLLSHGPTSDIGATLAADREYLVKQGPVQIGFQKYYRGDIINTADGNTGPIDPINTGDKTNNDNKENVILTENGGRPLYGFSLTGLEPETSVKSVAENSLGLIDVVPNPYYAFSEYEADKLDNRVKIINLPKTCNIKIYTMNGILVREFTKDDDSITSLDWDLKNHARIPIASGIYLIHVNVPGVGEKVLKWFGVMRPVDLDSF